MGSIIKRRRPRFKRSEIGTIVAYRARAGLTSFSLPATLSALRLVPTILLLLAFVALGSGAIEYMHNLDHQHADAREAAAMKEAGLPSHDGPVHDDNKDRKSTRLNSSHVEISYAVFCLKKKKK